MMEKDSNATQQITVLPETARDRSRCVNCVWPAARQVDETLGKPDPVDPSRQIAHQTGRLNDLTVGEPETAREIGRDPAEDCGRMRNQSPALPDAALLGHRDVERLANAYWDGLLSIRREPCAIVAIGNRLLRTSATMEALLTAGDGIWYRDRRLVSDVAGGSGSLDTIFTVATRDGGLNAGMCRIPRPSGRRPYIVTATPLPRNDAFPLPMQIAALIVVIDPDAQPVAASDQWRQVFALSARECEIAILLVDGHSIESAAERLGISTATARVHLRHLFAKLEVSRQSEMIRLLSRCG